MKKSKRDVVLVIFLSVIKIIIDIIIIFKLLKKASDIFVGIFGISMMIILTLIILFYGVIGYIFIPTTMCREFPFEIVYSVGGETFEKSGVFIVEYKYDYERVSKPGMRIGQRFDRSKDSNLLCEIDGEKYFLYCGDSEYYYNPDNVAISDKPGDYIYYYDRHTHSNIKFTLDEAEKLLGIKILSANFSDPVEELVYRPVDVINKLVAIICTTYAGVILVRACVTYKRGNVYRRRVRKRKEKGVLK